MYSALAGACKKIITEGGWEDKSILQDRAWGGEENLNKIGHHFVKTEEFEKSVAIGMSFMNELWNMMKSNKSFCMVLEYNAETLNVEVNYFRDVSDENPAEN